MWGKKVQKSLSTQNRNNLHWSVTKSTRTMFVRIESSGGKEYNKRRDRLRMLKLRRIKKT